METEKLEQIGLNKQEAKIYLALLELGETTIIPLSEKADIPRTTGYVVVKEMQKKGLLSLTKKGAHVYIAASSPEKLKEIAIMREQEAKSQRELTEKIVPQLQSYSNKNKLPQIQYFSGKEGLRAIFEDLLTSGEVKDQYVGSLEGVIGTVGEGFMKNWVKRRVTAGVFSYGVRVKSEELPLRTFRSSRKNMREIRFAPKGFESPFYTMIYGNNVAVISTQENFGLIIRSADFALTQKSLFDVLWKASRKFSD